MLDAVVDAINASGYGLTFGLHTRIDARVERIASALKVGNIYVNRNQIGAVVGSQPFGGEGLSGTGPKAGGPTISPASPPSACAPPTSPPQAATSGCWGWTKAPDCHPGRARQRAEPGSRTT